MGRIVQLNVWEGHDPLPDQRRFVNDPHKFRLFSSGYGSGKSSTGCRLSIAQSLEHPGSRDLVGRYERSTLTETTLVTYLEALDRIGLRDGTHFKFTARPPRIEWANGSTTLFMFLNDPTGAQYGSLELNTAFVDEGSEVDDAVYTTLFGSRLRWHLPGCTLKEQMAEWIRANPGKNPPADMTCPCMATHRGWVATNPGRSRYLRRVVTDGHPLWGVTHANVKGNPYNGVAYYEDMEHMAELQGGNWRERFIGGSWDHFEGQRFATLDRAWHVLEPEFEFRTGDWEHVEGIDFGWENPTHWVLLAKPNYQTAPLIVVDCIEESTLSRATWRGSSPSAACATASTPMCSSTRTPPATSPARRRGSPSSTCTVMRASTSFLRRGRRSPVRGPTACRRASTPP